MGDTPEGMVEDIAATIEEHGDMLYRICLIMLKNQSDAEDAVQETMIKLYQKAPAFRDDAHQKAWLIRVATNQCRDMLRYRKRHPQANELPWIPASVEPCESGILEALASLPDRYRLVLTLYYVQEYSVREIAGIIGRTTSAVKMRLQKGRRLLEQIYRKEWAE